MLTRALRLVARPWRATLLRKVASTLAEAEAAARQGDMPTMKVVGDPAVRLTEMPTPAQVADFVRWRSPAYIGPMSDGVADSLAGMLLGTDQPAPFTTADMNEFMTHSPSAWLAVREGDWWVFDFTRTRLHPTRKITIAGYRLHAETGAAEITDTWGRTYTEGHPLYETALTHTMCWWCHYIHSGLHNWVHFHLPDCMGEAHTALSDPDTVLARMVAPHVRFTARINMAGLWLNQSTDNGPGLLKGLKPWGASQNKASEFQRGIIENTGANYANLDAHLARPVSLDTRVPYLAYLSAWFPPIERFVRAVDPFIEDDAWRSFLSVLERGVPDIRRHDRVRLLAAFIWQVGVVHMADHTSYVERATPHGFHWVPENLDRPFTVADVRRFDRFKTRNFQNVFVRFHGAPGIRHGLLDVENYRFTEPPLARAADTLREELRAVDQDLLRRGLRIVAADRLLQSVCF